jgi:hypothetical protein
MSCDRCGGLMVVETSRYLMDEQSRAMIDTTRCLNCGNVEDAIIRANRIIARLPRLGEPRTAGARGPRAIQPSRPQRAIRQHGVTGECLRGSAPRPPIGAPSADPLAFDSAHSEPHDSIVKAQRRCA